MKEEEKRLGGKNERTSRIICNSWRALLRHFIKHLVKRDLFCFYLPLLRGIVGEVNLLAHLSNAGLRQWHLSGVVEQRKAFPHSVSHTVGV